MYYLHVTGRTPDFCVYYGTAVLCSYLGGDIPRIRLCLFAGSAVPLLMLLIWDGVAFSFAPVSGVADPLDVLVRLGSQISTIAVLVRSHTVR